ncbi:MAG: hypothetical protein WBE80_03625 [Methylocella sp.]
MPAKIHGVKLKKQERQRVKGLIRKGISLAARILKARILLKADDGRHGQGWRDERIIGRWIRARRWFTGCAGAMSGKGLRLS